MLRPFFLSRKRAVKPVETVSLPLEITRLQERIKNEKQTAETSASIMGGHIDMACTQEIVALEDQLSQLYADWSEGRLVY